MTKKALLASCAAAGLAAAMAAAPGISRAEDAAKPAEQANALTEVIVTAQKKSERLQDVPVPVTALKAQDLSDNGVLLIRDFFSSVPGLNIISTGYSGGDISIRGISTGSGSAGADNPTVAYVLDDAPFNSSTAGGTFAGAPDIDPSDLARVEVLKGPQGTLYGASSLGGLIKFVTIDPSTDRFSGRVAADVNGVQNGNAAGYGLTAAVNIPLADNLAVRISGYGRSIPGYIDNPILGQRGVNRGTADGAHVSLLWRPAPDWTVKLSSLFQDTYASGVSYSVVEFDKPNITLEQNHLIPDLDYNHHIQSFTAKVMGDLGFAKLTSISAYSGDQYHSHYDGTWLDGENGLFGDGSVQYFHVPYEISDSITNLRKYSEEFRLDGSVGRFDWLGGLFYTHEATNPESREEARAPGTFANVGTLYDSFTPATYAEYAVFGDLTTHLTDKFDIQLGFRENQIEQTYQEYDVGPENGPTPTIIPKTSARNTAFNYLVTPEYKFSRDLMAYARIATGYRPGGINPSCNFYSIPCSYGPDSTQNYELGVKGDVLEHALSFQFDIYHIDWNQIQLVVSTPQTSYQFNFGHARSDGLELSADYKVTHDLTVGGWVSLDDAKLTSAAPIPGEFDRGARVPYAPVASANLNVDYRKPLDDGFIPFVGGTLIYVGQREGDLAPDDGRTNLPGYTQVNFRFGVAKGSWKANAYVNNASDTRGLLLSRDYLPGTAKNTYTQPRTFGLTVARTF